MGKYGLSIDTSSRSFDTSKIDQFNEVIIAAKALEHSIIEFDINPLASLIRTSPSLIGWISENVDANTNIFARYALASSQHLDDATWLELSPTPICMEDHLAFRQEIVHLADSFSKSLLLEKHNSTLELARRVAELPDNDDDDIDTWAKKLASDIALAKD